MARVFFITPQWHSMCVLRFWFLWEALSSPHKRRTTYEMEIRFSFVKGLNTKTLISLVAPILRSSHLLPTAARVQERKAWEVQKVLMHKMPPNRRGRNAFLLFYPHLCASSHCSAPWLFVHLSRDWKRKRRLLHKLCWNHAIVTTHHTLRYKTILVCEPEDPR